MNSKQEAPTVQRLWLAGHIRACVVDHHVVLLDLKRNRYLATSLEHWLVVSSVIDSYSELDPPPDGLDHDARFRKIVMPLLQSGVVTHDPSPQPPIASIEDAVESLDAPDASSAATFRISATTRVLAASVHTAWWLRHRSLQAIAHAVVTRRILASANERPVARDNLRRSVATFDALRPFAFTARDKCLADSLTLINFLAKDGFFPSWVIGVKTNPFRAHSWVQSGGLVLNDLHENVRRYRPILVV